MLMKNLASKANVMLSMLCRAENHLCIEKLNSDMIDDFFLFFIFFTFLFIYFSYLLFLFFSLKLCLHNFELFIF